MVASFGSEMVNEGRPRASSRFHEGEREPSLSQGVRQEVPQWGERGPRKTWGVRHPFFLLTCSLLSNKVPCKKLLYHEERHSLRVNLFSPLVLLFQEEDGSSPLWVPSLSPGQKRGHTHRPDLASPPRRNAALLMKLSRKVTFSTLWKIERSRC